MEILGIDVTCEEFDYLMCQQSQGKDLKVVKGSVVAVDHTPTEEEVRRSTYNNLIENLIKTDYIANKLAEAETEEEKQALRIRYAEQLANRKKWREQINSLEN